MRRKAKEGVLVGLMLVGCIAAIAFVFLALRDPGGAFAGPSEEPATRRAEEPEPAPPARAEPDPEPEAEPEPEPEPEPPPEAEPEAEPAEEEPEPDPEPEPAGLDETAQLTLEIVAPAVEEERTVEVLVRDRFGEPLSYVLVVFRQGESILYRERTDREGRALFDPWPEETGPFRIDAIARGFLTATAKSVAAGAQTELTLMGRPSVAGVVRAPSKGAGTVKLFTEFSEREVDIAADGTFLFEDLEPGPVTVQAVVPPYGAEAESFYLRAGEQQQLQLRVREKSHATIFGRIRFWPGEGSLWINGVSVPVTHNGSYKFEKAVEGQNIVLVDAPGKALTEGRFTVEAGRSSRYNFRLHREGEIEGTVVGARTNRPVPDAEVRLGVNFSDPRNREITRYFPVDRVPLVRTDRDGRFTIRRLDERLLYQVSVVHPGFGQFLGEVTATGGRIRLELPEGPFVFGKVKGLGGVPRDAVVTAVPLERPIEGLRFNVDDWNRARSGRDRKGFYGLAGLLPGSYLVRVDAPGFGSVETVLDLNDPARRARVDLRLRRGDHVAQDEAELLARLPPVVMTDEETQDPGFLGDQATLLRFDFRRPANEVELPAVRVVLFDEQGREFHPQLEFDRLQFELYGLPEATYRAILQHPSLKKPWVQDDIVLKRGDPRTVALTADRR